MSLICGAQKAKATAIHGFLNQGGKPDFGAHAKTTKIKWKEYLSRR